MKQLKNIKYFLIAIIMISPMLMYINLSNTISGVITYNGNPLTNVQVNLSGTSASSTTTDANGEYSFTVNTGGSYTVTPQLSGYSFNPPSSFFLAVTSNKTANFEATLNTITISGIITLDSNPLSDVQVQLSGSSNATVYTNSNGEYSFTVVSGGSYVVAASKNGFSFTPTVITFSNITANQTGDFTALPNNLTVSGKVLLGGNGVANVTIYVIGTTNDTVFTDAAGNYSVSVAYGGVYTITPSKDGYTFNPTYKTITNIVSNQSIDFTASLDVLTISGKILFEGNPLSEVLVIIYGSKIDSITTGSSGEYSFSVSKNATYTVMPIKAGYIFIPDKKEFSSIQDSKTQDFIASQEKVTISGHITNKDSQNKRNSFLNSNTPVKGVKVLLSGYQIDSTTTNDSGYYSFRVLKSGTYIVTPISANLIFTPYYYTFSPLMNDVQADFIAEPMMPVNILPYIRKENVSTNPRFIWFYAGTKGNGLTFHLQVTTSPSFSGGIIDTAGILDTTIIIKGLQKGKKYYWRVRAEKGEEISPWSLSTDFTVCANKELTVTPLDNIKIGDRIPLILIHGWNFSGSPAPPSPQYWNNFISYYQQKTSLHSAYKIYFVNYYSNWLSVNDLAGMLRDEIQNLDQQDEKFASKEFVIISHSMGGLVARSFMQGHQFTNGIYAGQSCGARVKKLLTLGTPHHGSPIANGPARDAKIDPAQALVMKSLELTLFNEIQYNDFNRIDLHWDNFDNLLDYGKYQNEENSWLANNLNGNKSFDAKVNVYVGKYNGAISNPPYTGAKIYDVGSYVLSNNFNLISDGIVPYSSAIWEGHSPEKIHIMEDYNHDQIVMGKGDNVLFDLIYDDIMEYAPFLVYSPNGGECIKNRTSFKIQWSAPKNISSIDIFYSFDDGKTFNTLATNIQSRNGGDYDWLIPDTNSIQCFIKIINHENPNEFDISDEAFQIYHNWIYFTTPNQDTIWEQSDIQKISWNYNGIGQKVKISYIDNTPGVTSQTLVIQYYDIFNKSYDWNIPSTIPVTDQGYLKIEIIYLDEPCQNQSKNIKIYPARKITILKPNGGEEVWIDSVYNITYSMQGNINKLSLWYKDSNNIYKTIQDIDIDSSISNVIKSYSWKVPKMQGLNYSIKINDNERTGISDVSDNYFSVGYIGPKVISPDSDITLGSCFTGLELETRNINGIYEILFGTDSTFKNNTRIYKKSDGSIQIKYLPQNNIYFWRSRVYNSEWETFWSETRRIHLNSWLPGNNFKLFEPANKTKDLQRNVKFIWERGCEATYFNFQLGLDKDFNQIEKDTLIKNPYGFMDYTQDSISLDLILKKMNYSYYWRVRFKNDVGFGQWCNVNQFSTMDPCVSVKNVPICADGWTKMDDESIKSNGIIKIGSYFLIENGYVIINKERTAIINSSGTVKFKTTLRTIDIFTGFFKMEDGIIIPDSGYKVEIVKENLGNLSSEKLLIKALLPLNGEVQLSYSDRVIMLPISGIEQEGGKPIKVFVYNYFSINKDGSISGKLIGETNGHMVLKISSIKLDLTELTLQGDINSAYLIASDIKIDLGPLNFTGAEGYSMKGVKIKITPTNEITFVEGKLNKKCTVLQSFPDFSVCDFKFEAPKVLFEYIDDEKIWALTGKGDFILPIKFSLKPGVCILSAEFQIYSKKPFLHKVRFAIEGCVSIPIAPFVWFTGFGGSLTLRADDEGNISSAAVGGHVSLDIGTGSFPPIIRGRPGFYVDSKGILELNGKLLLFGFINMGEAKISVDFSEKNTTTLYGSARVELTPLFPWCISEIEGKIQFKEEQIGPFYKEIHTRMFFRGYSILQIPDKVLNKWGIGIPPKPLHLQGVYLEIGEFRDGNKRKGYGAQTKVHIFTYCYPNFHGTWKPWKWTWDCENLYAGVFIPFEAVPPMVGFNLYDLVTFKRSAAIRRKNDVSMMNNVIKYVSHSNIDTVYFNVPETLNRDLLFTMAYKSDVKPDMELINPEGIVIPSEEFLKNSPGSVFDSGYVMGVPNTPGTWIAIVKNITSKEDYDISVGGVNISPSMQILSVSQINDSIVKIKYKASDPDDDALIQFYYAEDDTAVGKTINPSLLIERNNEEEYLWNIGNVKNGTYHIYGTISDYKNPEFTARFNQPVIIQSGIVPSAISGYYIRKDTGAIKVIWDDNSLASNFEVYLGKSSHQYFDTISTIKNYVKIFPESDSTKYYLSAKSVNINGVKSVLSDEVSFDYNNIPIDTIPPLPPQNIQVNGVYIYSGIQENINFEPFISVKWSRVNEATGYIVDLKSLQNEETNEYYIRNSDSLIIAGLEEGKSYEVSMRSFDNMMNISASSNKFRVDLFDKADRDFDNMPDGLENLYFGSIEFTNDPDGDIDGDGLGNLFEMNQVTNPNNHDTDGDKVWDDADPNPLSNIDQDGDGMADDWEKYYEVYDPDADPDIDDLKNSDEYYYGTNPNDPDTDGGGQKDGLEISLNKNPNNKKDDLWDGKPAADVIDFKAEIVNDTIKLTWKTTKESYLTGFDIFRRDNKSGPYKRINDLVVSVPSDSLKTHGFVFQDTLIAANTPYEYILKANGKFDNSDSVAAVKVNISTIVLEAITQNIKKIELYQNYPNPFNPETNIIYQIPSESGLSQIPVKLIIYNNLGQKISTLVNQYQFPGRYRVTWNGRDSRNIPVSSGIYYYRIQIGDTKMQKAMLLIR